MQGDGAKKERKNALINGVFPRLVLVTQLVPILECLVTRYDKVHRY